jgi:predicted house-cleaning noncanonical NTP pyrophosphatase (MazG superfamily)
MLKSNYQGLQSFYAQMIQKIQQNEVEKRDSWVRCDLKSLEFALSEEIREYNESEKIEELVDIANICMMLYNRKKTDIRTEHLGNLKDSGIHDA